MRPPLPPFTEQSAIEKVRLAEDAWNGRDPEKVALAYTEDSAWRNRDSFVTGRAEIVRFLTEKWSNEREYRLIKELFLFNETGSPCDTPMNSTTPWVSGTAHTATKTGNSPPMA